MQIPSLWLPNHGSDTQQVLHVSPRHIDTRHQASLRDVHETQHTRKYHGTPITPLEVLSSLLETTDEWAGIDVCVSFFRPDQVDTLIALARDVFFDCGAYSAWRKGFILTSEYWLKYHEFCRRYKERAGIWFVIPDVIDAGTQEQEALIREWPADLRDQGAPVWHMDEPIHRLIRLTEEWPRVCIGSTAQYRVILSQAWISRMDRAWNALERHHRNTPPVHMLRGLQLAGLEWPFASLDSTDVARNHNRLKKHGPIKRESLRYAKLLAKVERWERRDCPRIWTPRGVIQSLTGDDDDL